MSDVMDRAETVPLAPPTPTDKAVRAHGKTLELSRDALKADVAELALASARGETGAQVALAALHQKIQAIEFEIEANFAACELAKAEDVAAEKAWRAAIQMLPPEEAIAGIGKDSCCGRCTPNVPGGCVLTGGVPVSECSHPVKQLHLFHRDESGRRIFLHRANPQASRVFDAACDRLNMKGKFA